MRSFETDGLSTRFIFDSLLADLLLKFLGFAPESQPTVPERPSDQQWHVPSSNLAETNRWLQCRTNLLFLELVELNTNSFFFSPEELPKGHLHEKLTQTNLVGFWGGCVPRCMEVAYPPMAGMRINQIRTWGRHLHPTVPQRVHNVCISFWTDLCSIPNVQNVIHGFNHKPCEIAQFLVNWMMVCILSSTKMFALYPTPTSTMQGWCRELPWCI